MGRRQREEKKTQQQSGRRKRIWVIAACAAVPLLGLVCWQFFLSSKLPPISSKPGDTGTQNPAQQREALEVANRMLTEIKNEVEVSEGNRTYHPSFGIFPRECKWRIVSVKDSKDVEYQWWVATTMPCLSVAQLLDLLEAGLYMVFRPMLLQLENAAPVPLRKLHPLPSLMRARWDFRAKKWVDERPAACTPQGWAKEEAPAGWQFSNGTSRSEVGGFCMCGCVCLHVGHATQHACVRACLWLITAMCSEVGGEWACMGDGLAWKAGPVCVLACGARPACMRVCVPVVAGCSVLAADWCRWLSAGTRAGWGWVGRNGVWV